MFDQLRNSFSQFFPPKPTFTEKDVSDLHGKVYIVTGATAGLGKELAKMLYSKNAKVYVAARSQTKANAAITELQAAHPQSKGTLVFLSLDLADLETIKGSAQRFLTTETKLHVLFNNAGLQSPLGLGQAGSRTPQGHEIHLGVNCLGGFLFTKLLTPLLVATAKTEPQGSVRVVWVSSSGTEISGKKRTGVEIDNLDYHIDRPAIVRYGLSKAGNWLHGCEYARRMKDQDVVSVSLNPGNLTSELFRDQGFFFRHMVGTFLYPVINGAYTELFAGLSPQVGIDNTGCWVVPFGRFLPIRKDLEDALKTEAEGGTDAARRFWDWSEEQVKEFV